MRAAKLKEPSSSFDDKDGEETSGAGYDRVILSVYVVGSSH